MSAGVLKPTPMITDVVPLDEAIENGFKRLLSDKDKLVKVLIKV
jgi:threonine dehydrogenase-like Zn-dependent dehydrogenase